MRRIDVSVGETMEERAFAEIEPEFPEPPLPQRGRRTPWWQKRPVQLSAGVGLVLVVAVAAWLASAAGGSSPAAAPSPSPTPLLVEGTLDLSFGLSFSPNATDPQEAAGATGPSIGDPCTALGGYNDISEGAAVTIGDGSGKTLVVAALSAGVVAGGADEALCEFSFTVTVPPGRGTYTVTISHRGTQVFSEAQIQQPIVLNLGS